MKWEEVRKMYSEKWILFEALEAHSESEKRVMVRKQYLTIF
ncbi:hypothetical protein [Clostridium arbusti]|nr:hypothetical protein [Clostridium arbusti]